MSPGAKKYHQDSHALHRPHLALQQHPLSEVQSEGFKVGMGAFQKRRPLPHQGPVLCTLLPSLWEKNLDNFLRNGLLKSKEMSGHSCSETGIEELHKYS